MAAGARIEINATPRKTMTLFEPGRKAPAFINPPQHVAIVMDGNGRWANSRGQTRTEGHKAGEAALLDVVAGAIEAGVKIMSVYAFSTENWKRSPEEIKFLMGFNREVLRNRRSTLIEWNVKVVWSGSRKKLWKSVVDELLVSEKLTEKCSGLILNMCVNYGGRVELVDAVKKLASQVESGKISAGSISEKTIQNSLYQPKLPDVDLFIRSSGEQRTSGFLPWQSSYAEISFQPTLWPDFTKEVLWDAIAEYQTRARRFGTAEDLPRQG